MFIESQRDEIEQSLAAGELQPLESQLHPHFLFNALHGMASLIDGDSENAKAMIAKISELLRMALDYSPNNRTLQQREGRESQRVAIRSKGRILFLNPAEVAAVEAEDNYVLLRRESDSYLLRESITAMAEKLKAYGFIRIHRSVLVNASFVQEIQPWFTGEYALRLKGGREYTVTRTYKKNLKYLADSWIGTDTFLGK